MVGDPEHLQLLGRTRLSCDCCFVTSIGRLRRFRWDRNVVGLSPDHWMRVEFKNGDMSRLISEDTDTMR